MKRALEWHGNDKCLWIARAKFAFEAAEFNAIGRDTQCPFAHRHTRCTLERHRLSAGESAPRVFEARFAECVKRKIECDAFDIEFCEGLA